MPLHLLSWVSNTEPNAVFQRYFGYRTSLLDWIGFRTLNLILFFNVTSVVKLRCWVGLGWVSNTDVFQRYFGRRTSLLSWV